MEAKQTQHLATKQFFLILLDTIILGPAINRSIQILLENTTLAMVFIRFIITRPGIIILALALLRFTIIPLVFGILQWALHHFMLIQPVAIMLALVPPH